MKKYKLTDETKIVNGTTLHRIEALRDFGDVKSGNIGGWIESENSLSHNGNCWVFDGAWVFGNARVSGDALVCDNAWVYGDALVFDDACVSGDAWVYDNAWVSGDALACDDVQVSGKDRQ